MTRSIGRVHRIGRLAATGAVLLAVGLASGCGSGQLAETSKIVPAVPGGQATVQPDPNNPVSQIFVQNVTIPFTTSAGYAAGSSAPLQIAIINQTISTVTVSPGSATLQAPDPNDPGNGKPIGVLAWASTAMPNGPVAPAALPSPSTPVPSDSVNPSDSGSPSPDESPSATAPAAPALADLKIATTDLLTLGPGSDQYLAITNLTRAFLPGDIANITLNFSVNGKSYTTTVAVPIGPPSGPVTRTSLPVPSPSS